MVDVYLSDSFLGFGDTQLGAAMTAIGVQVDVDASIAGSDQDLIQFRMPDGSHDVRFGHFDVVHLFKSVAVVE